MNGWVSLDVNDYNRLLDYKKEAELMAEKLEGLKHLYDIKEEEIIQMHRDNNPHAITTLFFDGEEIAPYLGIDINVRNRDLKELIKLIKEKRDAVE